MSDDAGVGKHDLSGPLEAALDLTPDMLHDHTDGFCLNLQRVTLLAS